MAIVIWGAWIASMANGRGLVDSVGQVIGADHLAFYAAGRALAEQAGATLYDAAYMRSVEIEIVGPALRRYYAFIAPPFVAAMFLPLASLPYLCSYVLWTGFGVAALYLTFLELEAARPARSFLWALTFFPVFATVSYGQTTFLTLTIFGWAYRLWVKDRLWPAGLVCSLALFKPHLALGLVIVSLARGARALGFLAGLASGAAIVAGACWWLLPDASRAYLDFARDVLPVLHDWLEFPLWNVHTSRGFWWLLVPGSRLLADALAVATGVMVIGGLFRRLRSLQANPRLQFAAAIVLSLLVSPHGAVYDWALLLIPAVILWQERPDLRPRWRVLFAIVWIAALVSGPLTLAQQRVLPAAIQVSVPALLVAATLALGWLEVRPAGAALSSDR
jgi:hypothetical protein